MTTVGAKQDREETGRRIMGIKSACLKGGCHQERTSRTNRKNARCSDQFVADASLRWTGHDRTSAVHEQRPPRPAPNYSVIHSCFRLRGRPQEYERSGAEALRSTMAEVDEELTPLGSPMLTLRGGMVGDFFFRLVTALPKANRTALRISQPPSSSCELWLEGCEN